MTQSETLSEILARINSQEDEDAIALVTGCINLFSLAIAKRHIPAWSQIDTVNLFKTCEILLKTREGGLEKEVEGGEFAPKRSRG